MRLMISVFFFAFIASLPGLAEPQPSAALTGTKLDPQSKKEIVAMEKQLSLAMEKRDTAALARILADTYFDTYEDAERAMSKAGAIARCQTGRHDFPVIEKEQKLSRNFDNVTVEGQAKFTPSRVDDLTPENQSIHVRRTWTKKGGNWLLSSQVRRLPEQTPHGLTEPTPDKSPR